VSSSDLRRGAPRDAGERAENAAGDRTADLLNRLESVRAEQQRLLDEMRSNERRLRALARRSWRIEEEERRRLAREIHDGVGQILAALKNELAGLAIAAAPGGGELAGAIELAGRALDETRELSRSLRPAVLDDLGLEPALRSLARGLGERARFTVGLRISGALDGLPPEIETLLYRVAQEALTNARRHSGASGATVELERRAGGVELRVIDAGRGCEPAVALVASEESPGIGLHSIRDRVALAGGEFRFDSRPGAGVTLAVALPIAAGPR